MPKMTSKTQINPINRVMAKNKAAPKSKKEINNSYYQKNKVELRLKRRIKYEQDKENEQQQRRERYQQQKEQEQLITKQTQAKYYGAEAFKILMSFKEYTELSKEKKQLWQDFNWTLQDCQKSFKEGYADIVAIMKLEQVANKLVRDYWDTAKSEERQKSKNWNLLDYDEQQKLIRYWAYEKTRIENGYIDTAEQLEKQSREYLKEIELAKYHEERGKKGCECYRCEERKKIQKEIKQEREKIIADYDRQSGAKDKEQCPECKKWVKELDENAGACKKCSAKYEN